MLIAILVIEVVNLLLVFLAFSLIEQVRKNGLAIHTEHETKFDIIMGAVVSSGKMLEVLVNYFVPKVEPPAVVEPEPAAEPVEDAPIPLPAGE